MEGCPVKAYWMASVAGLRSAEQAQEDVALEAVLSKRCAVRTYNGALLLEPREVATTQGAPHKVFTAYWRACLRLSSARRRWWITARRANVRLRAYRSISGQGAGTSRQVR